MSDHDWDELADMAARAAEQGPTVTALYPGRCPGCMEVWEPGDLITLDFAEDAWLCQECTSRA